MFAHTLHQLTPTYVYTIGGVMTPTYLVQLPDHSSRKIQHVST